jgi:hypothetical protein
MDAIERLRLVVEGSDVNPAGGFVKWWLKAFPEYEKVALETFTKELGPFAVGGFKQTDSSRDDNGAGFEYESVAQTKMAKIPGAAPEDTMLITSIIGDTLPTFSLELNGEYDKDNYGASRSMYWTMTMYVRRGKNIEEYGTIEWDQVFPTPEKFGKAFAASAKKFGDAVRSKLAKR